MRMHAQRRLLNDGRWHFQHGPIDIVLQLAGDTQACADAIEKTWQRFEQILPELVSELFYLRQAVSDLHDHEFKHPVAQRMHRATSLAAFASPDGFVTPMAVTVLAQTAAQADVAATLIANAVNLQDPRIQRRPADSLRDDTDLGARLVTVDVPPLSAGQIQQALQLGLDCARDMQARGLIHAALLSCQGHAVVAESLECRVES